MKRTGAVSVVFVVAFMLSMPALADIGSKQLGVANGDDWEPSIAADGLNVYVYWPHYIYSGTTPPVTVDSTGATCPAPSSVWTSYMYFQRSQDGGQTWGPISIPRCPINGNVVDAQVVIGPNHRLYIANMDGPADNTPIYLNYSDDNGATWHTPLNVAPANGGDHPELLVDSAGGAMIGSEYSSGNVTSTNTIAYVANVASPTVVLRTVVPPSGIVVPRHMSGTSLFTGGGFDTHGNAYYVLSDAMGNTKSATGQTWFWAARSSDHFATYTTSIIDTSETEPVITGEGWDYFGGSIQMAVLPRGGSTDRIVTLFNLGTVAAAPERIYTRYSDDNGVTWSSRLELTTAPAGTMHGFPSLQAISGMVKVQWQDNRVKSTCKSQSNCGVWNNYTRSSTDGATNWTPEVRVYAATVLAPHSYLVTTPSPGGFLHPYGDYTSMCTDGLGHFLSILGEGPSYTGPGGIYFSSL